MLDKICQLLILTMSVDIKLTWSIFWWVLDLKIEFDSDYDIDDVTRICHHWLRFVYKTDTIFANRKNRFGITRFILTNWIFRRKRKSINATKMNLNFIFGFLIFMAFSISVRDQWNQSTIRPVRDTCSRKEQLERTRSWKVLSKKVSIWVGKSLAKLERTDRSWKESTEVGKFLLKLESFAEVLKFWLKLESSGWTWKVQLHK